MDQIPKIPRSFVSRNLVAIVMVPSIIALHIGWNVMQNNRSLVKEQEQIDLPAVTFAKYMWRKISGQASPRAPKVSAKSVNETE